MCPFRNSKTVRTSRMIGGFFDFNRLVSSRGCIVAPFHLILLTQASTDMISYIPKNPVSQQHEWPGMPNQIKYIDRLFQRASQQHPDLFHDMRLRIKWRKSKEQHKRNEKLVFE